MLFFPDNTEQDRRASDSLHESKMNLLAGIRDSIEKPGTNKTIGDLLRSATPRERARVRAHLESRMSYWYSMSAPIEAGIAERAIRAFDKGIYDNGHIARYLNEKTIKEIFY